MPVLSTKLHIPEIRGNRIERRALVEKMVSGVKLGTKLTLVSAPAGYGKTTLVLEFLKSLCLKCAWISLDENDNDISQFLTYCIAALKKAGVVIDVDTDRIALDLDLSSTQTPMTMIINDIAALPKKVVLVLDDFHLIHSSQVYDSVKFLLEHQPPNFHLIIVTREDPHLPLSNLRVQREITEVRLEDLCFSLEETGDFFKEVMGLNLSKDVVSTVACRTEGWAAGLQLVGLSLNGYEEQGIQEFINVFKDTHRYIIDYLVEEVINRQTDKIRDFLCKTSILDRMNGALCDYIIDTNNSKQLLRELEKANLFLIPLDSKREWYRYHHLFADSLRAELTEKQEQEMQKRAATWFWDNGLRQEAVKHALKSGDIPLSIKYIEDNMEDVFKNAQLTTLVNWMNSIPEDLIKGNEILSVRKAWALYLIGKTREAVEYLNSFGEVFIQKTTPHNRGLLLSLRAIMAQQDGCDDPEVMAGEALKFLEPWDPIARIATLNTLGRAQEMKGSIKEAHETFKMAYNEALKLGCTFITTLALKNLGTSLNIMGKCMEAIELYEKYIERMISEFGKTLPFIGVIYLGLAELFYDQNELEKAKEYMDKGMELCRSISYGWSPYTGIIHARIRFAVGEREAAIKSMECALITAQGENKPGWVLRITAALTELLLRDGKIERGNEFVEVLKSHIESVRVEVSKEVYLAYVRLLIYQKEGYQACELLSSLERDTFKNNNLRELLTVYILYAEACYSVGDYEKTHEYLEKAIELAGPQGYYRLFLEDQELMKGLLLHLKKERGQYLQKIAEHLRLAEPEQKAPESEYRKSYSFRQEKTDELEYIDQLSKRELEILNLIVAGLSNNDIAKTLFISTNTTQWHISHIYSKLGVKNRTQAVLKARQSGIL